MSLYIEECECVCVTPGCQVPREYGYPRCTRCVDRRRERKAPSGPSADPSRAPSSPDDLGSLPLPGEPQGDPALWEV